MGRKPYPPNVVEQAQDVLVGWGQVDTDLTFGSSSLTTDALRADIDASMTMAALIRSLKKQLADARDQRDILYNSMWDKLKRVRAGVKATYGDDSQQFEKVGGTRMSDRKPRTRKGSTGTKVQ